MLLHTNNLEIGYQKHHIIAKSTSITIDKPGLTAVIGINGSGKSTLLKTLSGLTKPIGGEIYLNDISIDQLAPDHLSKQIGVVLTKQNLPLHLSVLEFVELGRYPHTNWLGINRHMDKKQVIKALQEVELYAIKNKTLSTLSDGQLQKTLIARVLAQDTPLIILDEPTTHLDLYHKALIFKLLKKISINKRTIVFATHEINIALQICDSILFIKDKDIIQGTPQDLLKNGVLQKLFPSDLIEFDKSIPFFRIKEI